MQSQKLLEFVLLKHQHDRLWAYMYMFKQLSNQVRVYVASYKMSVEINQEVYMAGLAFSGSL